MMLISSADASNWIDFTSSVPFCVGGGEGARSSPCLKPEFLLKHCVSYF